MRKGRVAFLAHVPDLDGLPPSARHALLETAFSAAMSRCHRPRQRHLHGRHRPAGQVGVPGRLDRKGPRQQPGERGHGSAARVLRWRAVQGAVARRSPPRLRRQPKPRSHLAADAAWPAAWPASVGLVCSTTRGARAWLSRSVRRSGWPHSTSFPPRGRSPSSTPAGTGASSRSRRVGAAKPTSRNWSSRPSRTWHPHWPALQRPPATRASMGSTTASQSRRRRRSPDWAPAKWGPLMSDLQLGRGPRTAPVRRPRSVVGLACNTRPKEPPQLMAVGDVRPT